MRDLAEKSLRIRAPKREKPNPLEGGQDEKVCRGAVHDDNRAATGFRRGSNGFFYLKWLRRERIRSRIGAGGSSGAIPTME
jgi:hypothetical protein